MKEAIVVHVPHSALQEYNARKLAAAIASATGLPDNQVVLVYYDAPHSELSYQVFGAPTVEDVFAVIDAELAKTCETRELVTE